MRDRLGMAVLVVDQNVRQSARFQRSPVPSSRPARMVFRRCSPLISPTTNNCGACFDDDLPIIAIRELVIRRARFVLDEPFRSAVVIVDAVHLVIVELRTRKPA